MSEEVTKFLELDQYLQYHQGECEKLEQQLNEMEWAAAEDWLMNRDRDMGRAFQAPER